MTLAGRTFTGIGRRGKYLLLGLDDGRTLVAHLRMTGRLLWRCGEAPAEQYERARIVLDDGHHLRWSDLRKFGTWKVLESDAELAARLGPEPIDANFSFPTFKRIFAGRRAPVKAVLLDQRRMAGLGNIYVDEALFEAGIRPDSIAGDVSEAALRRLHASVRAVLERGIAHRGASFRNYVDGQGEPGEQHMYVQVFRRDGQPCYWCGSIIERSVVGGRGTHYCPRCQKRPRKRKRSHAAG
ncbi:MAG: bifunctional DNA-formamidopyrimidine glycosylase/DNA-(apurinic or apyrimidinic site) lyase [Dehalococcoidia bacterium]|nr:bifunctional DNA-formamidopyrimidine glycosylase/DNA-(apurinic or apyrimidinic site) lyase [Dehalococcoidia bacterium]